MNACLSLSNIDKNVAAVCEPWNNKTAAPKHRFALLFRRGVYNLTRVLRRYFKIRRVCIAYTRIIWCTNLKHMYARVDDRRLVILGMLRLYAETVWISRATQRFVVHARNYATARLNLMNDLKCTLRWYVNYTVLCDCDASWLATRENFFQNFLDKMNNGFPSLYINLRISQFYFWNF